MLYIFNPSMKGICRWVVNFLLEMAEAQWVSNFWTPINAGWIETVWLYKQLVLPPEVIDSHGNNNHLYQSKIHVFFRMHRYSLQICNFWLREHSCTFWSINVLRQTHFQNWSNHLRTESQFLLLWYLHVFSPEIHPNFGGEISQIHILTWLNPWLNPKSWWVNPNFLMVKRNFAWLHHG